MMSHDLQFENTALIHGDSISHHGQSTEPTRRTVLNTFMKIGVLSLWNVLLVAKNAMYWVENVKCQQEYSSPLVQGTASDVEERLLFLGHGELAGTKGLNVLYAKGLSRSQVVSQDSQSFPCRWQVWHRCQFINGAGGEEWGKAWAVRTGGAWALMPSSLVLAVCVLWGWSPITPSSLTWG